jgi:hypothetical protein
VAYPQSLNLTLTMTLILTLTPRFHNSFFFLVLVLVTHRQNPSQASILPVLNGWGGGGGGDNFQHVIVNTDLV